MLDCGMNSTSHNENMSSGKEYQFYLKISIMCCMMILGTLGNGMILLTVSISNNPANYFFLNLAVVDMLITGVSMPIIFSNIIRSNASIAESQTFYSVCCFSAYMEAVILPVSWYSLAFTAVNLNCKICEPAFYKIHFKKKSVLTIIALIWVWSFVLNIFSMVGWVKLDHRNGSQSSSTEGGTYLRNSPPVVYDETSYICFLGIRNQEGRTFMTGFFSMVIPLFTIIFAYANMAVVIVRSRRTVIASIGYEQSKRRLKDESKFFRMVVTMVIVFLICWTPIIIFEYATTSQTRRSSPARLVLNWLALGYSAVKAFIYGTFSKKIRDGYQRTLQDLFSCRLLIHKSSRKSRRRRSNFSRNSNRISTISMAEENGEVSSIDKKIEMATMNVNVTKCSPQRTISNHKKSDKNGSTNMVIEVKPDVHSSFD